MTDNVISLIPPPTAQEVEERKLRLAASLDELRRSRVVLDALLLMLEDQSDTFAKKENWAVDLTFGYLDVALSSQRDLRDAINAFALEPAATYSDIGSWLEVSPGRNRTRGICGKNGLTVGDGTLNGPETSTNEETCG